MAIITNSKTGRSVDTSYLWGYGKPEFWGPADGYYYNNLFRWGVDAKNVEDALVYMQSTGDTSRLGLIKYLRETKGSKLDDRQINLLREDALTFFKQELGMDESDINSLSSTDSAQQSAYDEYYRDLYSLEEGTLGRQMLDNYTTAEQNAALSNMQLAEAQYQQAAMQQAETVKAITDSVKSERMARLRAGMSESQIANQDMQTMLTNMNTLNQSTNTLNQNRLAAQQQYNLAQDTAYQQYIQSVTGMGGTSSAFAASDAGSAHRSALNYMKVTGEKDYNKALAAVTTGGNK